MALRNTNKEAALSLDALRSCLHYDPETGLFTRLTNESNRSPAGSIAGTVLATGYRVIRVCNGRFLAHRLAWFYVYGAWPNEIDHLNRVKDDNRFSNLRASTRQQNVFNSGPRGKLRIKHISRKRSNYTVRIVSGDESVYRKTFCCLGQAVKARNATLQTMNAGG